MATKKTTTRHKKTIIYITAVGKEPILSEIVECSCTETKGLDHPSAQYRK